MFRIGKAGFLSNDFSKGSMCMSSKRNIPNLDYKIFHESGEKVEKIRKPKMDDNLKKMAIHIASDVDDFLDSYEIDVNSDENDLGEYVTKLDALKKEYRRIDVFTGKLKHQMRKTSMFCIRPLNR